MSESRSKSRSHAAILEGEPRCIYCSNPPTEIEHMPPITMFKDRRRPSGMEFATCKDCNSQTSGSDATAALFSRIEPKDDLNTWQHTEAIRLRNSVKAKAPGVLDEIFSRSYTENIPLRTASGIIIGRGVSVHANGPLVAGYLGAFSSKLAMALYRKHIGQALPLDGSAYSQWFLNAGLTQKQADGFLSFLPVLDGVQQGKFQVEDQFGYRYNSDNRTIVAALTHFHHNLHVFSISTSEPQKYESVFARQKGATLVKPGEILTLVPVGGRRITRTPI